MRSLQRSMSPSNNKYCHKHSSIKLIKNSFKRRHWARTKKKYKMFIITHSLNLLTRLWTRKDHIKIKVDLCPGLKTQGLLNKPPLTMKLRKYQNIVFRKSLSGHRQALDQNMLLCLHHRLRLKMSTVMTSNNHHWLKVKKSG